MLCRTGGRAAPKHKDGGESRGQQESQALVNVWAWSGPVLRIALVGSGLLAGPAARVSARRSGHDKASPPSASSASGSGTLASMWPAPRPSWPALMPRWRPNWRQPAETARPSIPFRSVEARPAPPKKSVRLERSGRPQQLPQGGEGAGLRRAARPTKRGKPLRPSSSPCGCLPEAHAVRRDRANERAQFDAVAADVARINQQARLAPLLFSALAIGAGAWLGLWLTRSIGRPVQNAARSSAEGIATYDLGPKACPRRPGPARETDQLLSSLDDMQSAFRSLITGALAAEGAPPVPKSSDALLDLRTAPRWRRVQPPAGSPAISELNDTVRATDQSRASNANRLAAEAGGGPAGARPRQRGRRHHGLDHRQLAQDQRHHWRDRRHRLPDQHPGA